MSLSLVGTVDDAEKHDYDVTSLIFAKGNIYSSADDGIIKIWDSNLKLQKQIQANPCSVYSLTSDETYLYSCSSDGSVKSWKLGTLEEGPVIKEPDDREMWKIYWNNGNLLAVDDQGIIHLYKNNKIWFQIEMMEQIKDVALNGNLVYAVRDLDLTITEILPGDKGKFMSKRTLTGRAPLCLLGDKICYSSREGFDVFVNDNNENHFKDIAKIKAAHEMVINALSAYKKGEEEFVISAGWDKVVKLWRISPDGSTKNSGSAPVSGYVNALCVNADNTTVFAGGADGKIWKISIQN